MAENWKHRLQEWTTSTRGKLANRWKNSPRAQAFQNRLTTFEPSSAAEWVNRTFQKQGAAFYGKLITLVLCVYFLADIAAVLVGKYIPEPPAVRGTKTGGLTKRTSSLDDYGPIFSRNLFNSRGLIPGEEVASPTGPQDPGGPAVRTSLPFNLVGTVVLKQELQSIGAIEDKSASVVYPVRINDEIPSKAKILKIEPDKVTFLNLSSGRREFIDIPESAQGNAPKITISGRGTGGGGIEQTSPTQFNISKVEVDKTLADFNNVLTQARAIPHQENGVPAGYKLFQIVPGSIYAKLGLENNDIIQGLNGEPVNDPGKAFEALSQLKQGANHLELQVKRGGRVMNFTYDIH